MIVENWISRKTVEKRIIQQTGFPVIFQKRRELLENTQFSRKNRNFPKTLFAVILRQWAKLIVRPEAATLRKTRFLVILLFS